MSKDGLITYIYVLNNGKMIKYNIFDNDVTLGRLSKLNDDQTIKLAKEQDKKYATTGAIEEIKSGLKGNGQVGQEDDYKDVWVVSVGRFQVYAKHGNSPDRHFDKIKSPNENSDAGFRITNLKPYGPTYDNSYGKAMIKHIQKTPYQAPKAQEIEVKNTTGDSGNKIISQKIYYKGISMFDEEPAEENLYHYALKNKDDFLESINLSTRFNYINEQTKETTDRANALYDKLFKGQQFNLTKNVYGYHPYDASMVLYKEFVTQQIYKSRYIGYPQMYGYLVTKAQNKNQKIEFSK